jgi:2-methylcitrate dehydratase PrpD
MMPSLSQQAAHWIKNVQFSDLPEEVIEDTKLRVLDYIGLILAAASMPIGKTFRDGVLEIESLGNTRGEGATILGYGDTTSPLWATIANGGMSHALDYDDTHNETVNHITGPVASAALSLGESLGISGKEFLATVTAGNELSCRIGTCSPITLLAIGWHPTSIIGTLAAGQVAGRLLGLSEEHLKDTMGITGSQASGLMEHLQDGALVKSMHPGWNAHAGMVAAYLAKNGLTGPATVLEGRNGIFRTHVQKENYEFTFDRMMKDIGKEWEILNASFKPYPCAHIIHPFLDALLYLYHEEGVRADDVKKITCLVADYLVPISLEPAKEKTRPRTDYHGRFSLQYSLGAALYFGRLGVEACEEKYINDPAILAQVDKVTYEIDKDAPSTRQFKGWVKIETTDGRELEKIVDHNWGSKENPMEPADIERKFRENALLMLPENQVSEIIEKVQGLEKLQNIRELIPPCIVQK